MNNNMELKEKIELLKKEETYIEDCENCGALGYSRASYGRGKDTGDAWGDAYYPLGSVVYCLECAPLFRIGKEWNGEEIWKTGSMNELSPEQNKFRINSITRKSVENVGFNKALKQVLELL